MTLSIIIPAYNEEDRIVITLEKTIAYLSRQDYESEIIVVSDGSRDATCSVAQGFTVKPPVTLRALEYHPNHGKGYAVRYGMLKGRGDWIMFMDADYAVPIEYVEKGLVLLQKGFAIAIASRAVAGATVTSHQNMARTFSAKLYTFLQNQYLGFNYRDTQCGFKLFTRQAARDLFSRQKLHSVIFDPEILWLAKRGGYEVAEFPVTWRHVEDSRIQYDCLKKSLFVFQELWRIRRLH